ncbi:hypothetical protein F4809DRAFT_604002 [Biscogniauxia mediterranea]|nr:hypothetical protein F4809DRAFT_604002 [Biscogniauxia mediterranea]
MLFFLRTGGEGGGVKVKKKVRLLLVMLWRAPSCAAPLLPAPPPRRGLEFGNFLWCDPPYTVVPLTHDGRWVIWVAVTKLGGDKGRKGV